MEYLERRRNHFLSYTRLSTFYISIHNRVKASGRPSLFLLCRFLVLFIEKFLGIVLTQVCIIGLKIFFRDIFFVTLWARAFPPSHARPLNHLSSS